MKVEKQRDPRVTFSSEGVRGDAIYAFRAVLDEKGIEEGEFLSQLFEQAVVELKGGAGPGYLAVLKNNYHRYEKNEP